MKHTEAFEKLCLDARSRVREISIDSLCQKRADGENFHLLDVREDHEWDAGRIPGSSHLGRGIIERDIEGVVPDYDAEIILYCGGGYRSALAADNLQKMGYRNVLSMAGGIRAWREAGLEEER
ncbi:MAG: sulfurtransferase [Acidobacteria bacterium]|nr:sulfurtransferase [Acidobacteriota bacterium]